MSAKAGRIGTSPLLAGSEEVQRIKPTSPQLADAGCGVDVNAIRLPRGVFPRPCLLNLVYQRPFPSQARTKYVFRSCPSKIIPLKVFHEVWGFWVLNVRVC